MTEKKPGDIVNVDIIVSKPTTGMCDVWIGLSLKLQDGTIVDYDMQKVTLSGTTSAKTTFSFQLDANAPLGRYELRTCAWSKYIPMGRDDPTAVRYSCLPSPTTWGYAFDVVSAPVVCTAVITSYVVS